MRSIKATGNILSLGIVFLACTLLYLAPNLPHPFTAKISVVPCSTPVYAGKDGNYTICNSSTDKILLNQIIVDEQAGGKWSRISGTGGLFNPFDGSFIPSASSTNSIFQYVVTGISPCPNDTSLATLFINVQSFAGTDGNYTLCENSIEQIKLSNYIQGEDPNGQWIRLNGTGGDFNSSTGVFTTTSGSTSSTFQYITTGNWPCIADTSNVSIILENSADAGSDATIDVCANSNQLINLNEEIKSTKPGGLWSRLSGSLGAFNAIDGTFIPAINSTNSVFMYVSYANYPCMNDTSYVRITILNKLNAGLDGSLTVCAHSTQAVNLYNVITNEQKNGKWTRISGTGGNFNAQNASFIPAVGATLSVFRYIISSGYSCTNDTSYATVNIASNVSAGKDNEIIFCDHLTRNINLFDIITNEQTGGSWSRISGKGGIYVSGTSSVIINDSFTTSVFQYVKFATSPCLNDTSYATIKVPDHLIHNKFYTSTFCETDKQILKLANLIEENTDKGVWQRSEGVGGKFNAMNGTFQMEGANEKNTFLYILPHDSTCLSDTIKLTIFIERKNAAGNDGVYISCENELQFLDLFSLIWNEKAGGEWINLSGFGGESNSTTGLFIPEINNGELNFIYVNKSSGICGVDTSELNIIFESKNFAGKDSTINVCYGQELDIHLADLLINEDSGGNWYPLEGLEGDLNRNTGSYWIKSITKDAVFLYIQDVHKLCSADTSIIKIIVNKPNAGNDILLDCLPIFPKQQIYLQATGNGFWTNINSNFEKPIIVDIYKPNTEIRNFNFPGTYGFIWNDLYNCRDTVFIIIPKDTLPPKIQCPDDLTLECGFEFSSDNSGKPLVSDNCNVEQLSITFEDELKTSCENQFRLSRKWLVADLQGNSDHCIQSITVNDDQPPHIICPIDITTYCGKSTNPDFTGIPVVEDNCHATFLHYEDTGNSCDEVKRKWIVTDECNNKDSCFQIIYKKSIDLAFTQKIISAEPFRYGQALVMRLYIYNQGDQTIDSVSIREKIPEGYDIDITNTKNASWQSLMNRTIIINSSTEILPHSLDSIDLVLTLKMTKGGFDKWICRGEIVDAYIDHQSIINYDIDSEANSNLPLENDVIPGSFYDDRTNGQGALFYDDEDDSDPAGIWIADLAGIIENEKDTIAYFGDTIKFPISIYNQGNVDCQKFLLHVKIPEGFIFSTSLNPNWIFDSLTTETYHEDSLTLNSGVLRPFYLLLISNAKLQKANPESWTVNFEIAEEQFNYNGRFIHDIDSKPDYIWTNDAGSLPKPDREPGKNVGNDDIISGDGTGIINDISETKDEDDRDDEFVQCRDLALKILINSKLNIFAKGDTIEYNIIVYNQGNQDFDELAIEDYLPDGLLFDENLNSLWKMSSGKLIYKNNKPCMAADSVSLKLVLIIDHNHDLTCDLLENFAEIISAKTLSESILQDVDSKFGSNSEYEKHVSSNPLFDDELFGHGQEFNEDEDDHDIAKINCWGKVNGVVWFDENENGIRENWENGAESTEVQLYDCVSKILIDKKITDKNGQYSFNRIETGLTYFMKVICPETNQCVFAKAKEGNNADIDSDFDSNGLTACFTILSGETLQHQDAGIILPSRIGDFVWHDLNGNGIQDKDEIGIPEIKLQLIKADSNTLERETISNAAGHYYLKNVNKGEYFLIASSEDKNWHVSKLDGAAEVEDNDFYFNRDSWRTSTFNIDKNTQRLDQDLGLWKCAKLEGYLWFDSNTDGIFQKGERGFNNLTVLLIEVKTQAVYQRIKTQNKGPDNRSGYYLISCIEPGEYFLQFPDLKILKSSLPFQGSDSTLDSDMDNSNGLFTSRSLPINSNDYIKHIDAGYSLTKGEMIYHSDLSVDNYFVEQNIKADESGNDIDISIQPNPVHDELIIKIQNNDSQNYKIILKDLVGNVIDNLECNPVMAKEFYKMNMKNKLSGTYILEIIGENLNKQFIIIRQ